MWCVWEWVYGGVGDGCGCGMRVGGDARVARGRRRVRVEIGEWNC